MGRLTFKNPDGTWGLVHHDIQKTPIELYGALCKLKDYEETGLEPGQITEIDELYRKKCEELAAAQEECIPEKHEGIMRCKCRNGVYGGENYCSKCGRKLKWRRRDK